MANLVSRALLGSRTCLSRCFSRPPAGEASEMRTEGRAWIYSLQGDGSRSWWEPSRSREYLPARVDVLSRGSHTVL